MTLQQSDVRFEVVERSKLAAFVGLAFRNNIKTVRSYVTSMLSGRPPVLERLGGADQALANEIRVALSNFCRVEAAGSSTALAMIGAPAANHMAQAMLDQHAKGEVIQFRELSSVWAFFWLLDADTSQKFTKLRSEVLVKSGASTAATEPASSSSSSSKPAGGKKGGDKTFTTKEMVRAMFKNEA